MRRFSKILYLSIFCIHVGECIFANLQNVNSLTTYFKYKFEFRMFNLSEKIASLKVTNIPSKWFICINYKSEWMKNIFIINKNVQV